MITNEQLNEIFKPLFDAAKEKGLLMNGIMFHPHFSRPATIGISGHSSALLDGESFDDVMNQLTALPAPETDEERIRRELLHHENKANELRAQLEAAQ